MEGGEKKDLDDGVADQDESQGLGVVVGKHGHRVQETVVGELLL